MFNRFLDRLEARVGRYRGIRNLMSLVVIGMAFVFIADMFLPFMLGKSMSSLLMFNKAAILRGEIWRLVTFIFIPPNSSIFFIIISLYFYWMLGNDLQTEWGTFRFTVFYTCGMLGSVIAGTITGYATSYYLNLSLFLATAILYPDRPLRLYGILEFKFKWLALIDVAILVYEAVFSTWPQRLAIVVSLLNVLLFFTDRLIERAKNAYRHYQWKKNWRTGNWR